MQKIIDLTLPYTDHMPCQSAFPGNVFVQLKSHEETLALKQGTQDDPFTSAWHYISTVDHIGTHIDAFYHMSPTGEPVDQMPLEMFFGKAVCLDLRSIPDRGTITVDDMEAAERKAGVKINGHIVLLCTGVSRYYPRPECIFSNPELSAEATHWLADHGSKVHGVEGPSTDIMDEKRFVSHRVCRERKITHYEWLVNLDRLVGKGEFWFCGVPLRLVGASASPVRAFAILDETDQ